MTKVAGESVERARERRMQCPQHLAHGVDVAEITEVADALIGGEKTAG